MNNAMTASFTLFGNSIRAVIEFEDRQSSGTGGGFPRYGASNPERIGASDMTVPVSILDMAFRSSKTHEEFRFAIFSGSPAQGRKYGRTDEKQCLDGSMSKSAGTFGRPRSERGCRFLLTAAVPQRVAIALSRKVGFMRLIVCVATLAVIGLSTAASAGENAVHVLPASTASASVPVVNVSQSNSIFQPVRRSQGGFFSRVMELERRKNAWLRRTFLQ